MATAWKELKKVVTNQWRLHTKLYRGAWNVSANNSETVGHKDPRLGQIVYKLVFYNILGPRDPKRIGRAQ